MWLKKNKRKKKKIKKLSSLSTCATTSTQPTTVGGHFYNPEIVENYFVYPILF